MILSVLMDNGAGNETLLRRTEAKVLREQEQYCFGCMRPIEDEKGICPHCGHDNHVRDNGPGCLPEMLLCSGKYLVGKRLGHGGFGITYIGRDMVLGRTVAIKEFYPKQLVTRDTQTQRLRALSLPGCAENFQKSRERAIREGRVGISLDKVKHIVRTYDVFLENDTVYLVMEYIEGQTLKQYVCSHGGKLGFERELFPMLAPVMETLEEIHRLGYIHRDISPDNVMIREGTQEAVLLDFGAAREIERTDESTSITFREGYTAPEQYITNGDARTDEYALCATMYYALKGEAPLNALQRTVNDTLKAPREAGAEISANGSAAIMKGMSVRAEERYESMEELRQALEAGKEEADAGADVARGWKGILQESGEEVQEGSADEVRQGGLRGLPKGAVAALSVVIVCALGAGIWMLGRNSAPQTAPAALTAEVPTQAPTEVPTQVPTRAASETASGEETMTAQEMYALGVSYYNGDGMEQNYEMAVTWFEKAAEAGNVDAMTYLGYCYGSGLGVEQDYEAAVGWYQKAADAGNATARGNLGLCYYNGDGVDQNYETAVEWFQKAADAGNASAMRNLGVCYENGEGVEQDFEAAQEWYQKAQAAGYAASEDIARVEEKIAQAASLELCVEPVDCLGDDGVYIIPTDTETLSFAWEAVAGAQRYRVEVLDGASNVWNSQECAGTSAELEAAGMAWGEVYTLRVTAESAEGKDGAAEELRFTPGPELLDFSIDGKYGYIDRTGEVVIEPVWADAETFSEGLARVWLDGKWGYIDRTGEVVIEPVWDSAYSFSEGLALVELDGKRGFIDQTGEMVIEPVWVNVGFFLEGLALVELDGKYGFIDRTGEVVIEPVWDFADLFYEGLARVRLGGFMDGKYGYIDRTGEVVIEPVWDLVGSFSEGLADAELDGKFGYIDKTGEVVIEPVWDETGHFSEGLAEVKLDGEWGFIDQTGELLGDRMWDDAYSFSGGLAYVELGDNTGYIDRTGTPVTPGLE